MNTFFRFVLLICWTLSCTSIVAQSLCISPDKRFLLQENGEVFLYMGDTAWELFHRLNKEEADYYLEDRAAKGFNVIQAVILAELDGLNTPNANGDPPLHDNDPTKPNENYFEYIDELVEKASSLNLYMGLLPTWGKYWKENNQDPKTKIFSPENAYIYGRFLANRYKGDPIIWILGGDNNPETAEEMAINQAMAKGIREISQGEQLMTFHPRGGRASSEWFHQEEWLDFNLFQSGHNGPDFLNYTFTENDYQLKPTKPTLDGEPRYEDIVRSFNVLKGRQEAYDVRQAAYWSILSGACGHTYGNNNIWQMWAPDKKEVIFARIHWKDALQQPGAAQVAAITRLFEKRDFLQLRPDQELVKVPLGTDKSMFRSIKAEDGSYLMVYSAKGEAFEVNIASLRGNEVKAHWYNPGEFIPYPIEKSDWQEKETHWMVPPSKGETLDWLLIMDAE